MKIAYICSPYRAASEAELDNHIEYAQEITKRALAAGYAPITPHLYITQVTNDNIPEERAAGMAAGLELLERCDVVITGGRYGISDGMQAELSRATKLGIEILVDTEL